MTHWNLTVLLDLGTEGIRVKHPRCLVHQIFGYSFRSPSPFDRCICPTNVVYQTQVAQQSIAACQIPRWRKATSKQRAKIVMPESTTQHIQDVTCRKCLQQPLCYNRATEVWDGALEPAEHSS